MVTSMVGSQVTVVFPLTLVALTTGCGLALSWESSPRPALSVKYCQYLINYKEFQVIILPWYFACAISGGPPPRLRPAPQDPLTRPRPSCVRMPSLPARTFVRQSVGRRARPREPAWH